MGEALDIGLDHILKVGAMDLCGLGKVSLERDSKLKTFVKTEYFQGIFIVFCRGVHPQNVTLK